MKSEHLQLPNFFPNDDVMNHELKWYDMRMKKRNTPLILGDSCTSNHRS